jgi:hypothetical protein
MSEIKFKSLGFSKQDLELLGYREVEEIEHENFNVLTGVASAGLEKVVGHFIYLKTRYTQADAERALKELPKDSKSYVVIPESLSDRRHSLQAMFGSVAKVHIHEELIWEKITQIFSDYLTCLSANVPQEPYYVAPRREGADPKERLDLELVATLASKKTTVLGKVTVVRAPAGVGKTTLSRQITKNLCAQVKARRLIPIYVESSHWSKLQISSLEDLWEMIDNSLRAFSPSLRINRELFEHLLRQGYLAFIFDGFDELCTQRHSSFTPKQVLDQLKALAVESMAKILITTRTLFWEAAMGSETSGVVILDLASFNKQQVEGYFTNFFKLNPSKQAKAKALYTELLKNNKPITGGGSRAQFVNHPFCISLIAQCVERGIGDSFEFEEKKSFVFQFLNQICKRERQRQNLVTSAEMQLAAFEEIAVSLSSSNESQFELEMCEAAGFDSKDMAKLIDHPLLDIKDSRGDKRYFGFRYDFLPEILRARYLVNALRTFRHQTLVSDSQAWSLMAREANGKGNLVEHMLTLLEVNDLPSLGAYYRATARVVNRDDRPKSFLFHIARRLVEMGEANLTKRDRTMRLFSTLFGDDFAKSKLLTNGYFEGQIDKLDFTGVTFNSCKFFEASFVDCLADGKTCFQSCVFSGTFEVSGERKTWADVQLDKNCRLEFPTNLAWEEIAAKGAGSKEQNMNDALKLALGKFWRNGQPHFSIPAVYWAKGPLGHSIYCKSLFQAMTSCGVIKKISISGVQDGGYAFSREVLPDLQRYMDNGQLTGKLREVYRMLLQ